VIAVSAFTLRFGLAIVLAVAAVAKARSFGAFVRTVNAVVPWQRTARAAAAAVIAVEAALAVLLAAGVWVNAVSLATLALFLGFAAISLWATRHGLHVRCNCFGQSERELGKDSLITSLLLAGATVAYWALLRQTDESLSLGELPVALVLGVATVLGTRWVFAGTQLAGIVRQRKVLESDLAKTTGAFTR
jgi:methylamine utilization protein MauE